MAKKILNNSMMFILVGFLGIFLVLVIGLIREYNFSNLATFGLCLLTGIYAFATILLVFENRKTLQEIQQTRIDAVKPAFSIQPEGFTAGGGFSYLYLVNSGGVAREVKVDIEATNLDSKKLLYIPTIERGHKVYLFIGGDIYYKGGHVKVVVFFKDSYNQELSQILEIDFSIIKKEGRMIWGQYSDINDILRELQGIERSIESIKGAIPKH